MIGRPMAYEVYSQFPSRSFGCVLQDWAMGRRIATYLAFHLVCPALSETIVKN